MRNRMSGALAGWLAVLTIAQAAAFVEIWSVFVRRPHGQLLDTLALTGNSIGQNAVNGPVATVLNGLSLVSVAAAAVAIAVIALLRGRVLLALVAVGVIVAAGGMAQVLKQVITRPDLGIDPERAAAGNSLPSGHTAVAAAVAVALVLVLPGPARGIGAVLGAAYTAIVGVATLSAGWHRPSDAVAAMLVVGACASVGGLILLAGQRPYRDGAGQTAAVPGAGPSADPVDGPAPGLLARQAHPKTTAFLVITALVLAAACALAVSWADPGQADAVNQVGRTRLFAGYAGSAAGITATAAVMMALVLATAHRVVPTRRLESEPVPA